MGGWSSLKDDGVRRLFYRCWWGGLFFSQNTTLAASFSQLVLILSEENDMPLPVAHRKHVDDDVRQ